MKKSQAIILPLDLETAEEISRSSEVDREDIARLLSLWLKRRKKERVEDFFSAIEEISSNARARGLTENILDQLLATP